MLERIIGWSVRHRATVLLAAAGLTAAGAWALWRTPVDAIPDLSDVQVIVMTEWPGQAAQLVEDQVTYPLSTEMLKVPHTKHVRGMSQFGLSAVFVIFEDGTDLYWARSRVLEYMSAATERLPDGARPVLGPDATGVGWVMQYILADTSGSLDLAHLRALQDWTVKPALTAVRGVAEIASLGGFEKQYQIEVDPTRLLAYGIPVENVVRAIEASNRDTGGRAIELGGTEHVVRTRGRLSGVQDVRAVPLGVGAGGTAITVGDVATVQIGPELRRGIAELNGRGEVVTGIVVMRYGENPLAVIQRVKQKMVEVERTLPAGVTFVQGYDRSELILRAIATLREKLIEESLIVAGVTLLFLLHARSALVAVVTLPIGILMAFAGMRLLGVDANIMSLGGIAIAIGAMIDAGIVMVENLHKHVERDQREGTYTEHWLRVARATKEVGPSLFVSLLIITVSFLPVFALEAQEGRLFHPLAWTKTLAMGAAAMLSVTLVPVLMGLLIRGGVKPETANPINRGLIAAYRPLIRFVLRHRVAVLAGAAFALIATAWPWSQLGSEFMPPLNEGAIVDMPAVFPGLGTAQAKQIIEQRDAAMAAVPEVALVLGKVGRAETATDMAPLSMIESVAVLKARNDWRPGVTYDSIVAELNATVRTPGVANMWSMPIKNRLDMLATGVRTPVGIKLFGQELGELDRLGKEIEGLLAHVPGTNAVFAERSLAGRYLDIEVNRTAAARHGMTTDDVQLAIATAVGGTHATEVLEGRARFSVLVRYPRALRDSPEKLAGVLVATRSGAQVALGELADIRVTTGAPLIRSEDAVLSSVVYVDVRGRDIGSYVKEARGLVDERITLGPGMRLEWSGQFEAMQRANRRLLIVVPLTLTIIFLLLYWNFQSVAEAAIVMLSLPFSIVGGIWLLWLLGYDTSVATGIGFIALAGVAAETGVVMLIYLDHAYRDRMSLGGVRGVREINAAVEYGAVERVRPKLMTVLTVILGLVPILWSQGTGADMMKRIAAPMVGGMVSSTVLTLLVIPAVYSLWRERSTLAATLRSEARATTNGSRRSSTRPQHAVAP